MLEGRIVLEVGIRRQTNRRVLAEIVLVDKGVIVGDFADIRALTALESCRLAGLLEGIETIVAVGAEIHLVYPYIPSSDRNSFFPTQFCAFKTGWTP